ncbi:ArsR/SmtB family transcription factor [Natrialbaceae archaeon AArc-T1-2]|uniref:ArsR/SmtB family transcription factor n=1 Tax=Natrialbaceae archaeon AArc-T1-2 TaxID=3053904 RepID=UPI00255ACDBA|nr:helix-turn-helix domain-containing protein [Natrialbaceae archaeon AArc-T1-2]WIV67965.1 helix-turn-helix domain-containing protein [Natrialbaceae archaeon AArc-T1-2]
MARLFPFRSETSSEEGQPRVVDLAGEDADAVFSALSSTTAREIYARLDEEPGTPSDVAESIDSSIQNVRYHLEKLEEAGLVDVVDTWYSEKGNEMSVYATANGPLIVTGNESTATKLKDALSRFVGGLAALAGGSLLVQYGARQFFSPTVEEYTGPTADPAPTATDDEPADEPATEDEPTDDTDDEVDAFASPDDEPAADEDEDVADEEPEADDADEEDVAFEDADDVGDPAAPDGEVPVVTDAGPDALETATTLPPGLLFFLGGLLVLVIVTAYWYWSARRLA